MKESLLHAIICSNVLQNIPRKFLVQFPCNKRHTHGHEADDGGNRDEKRLQFGPEFLRGDIGIKSPVTRQDVDGHLNLIHLKGSVDQHSQVGNADTNDLNCVFHAKGVPNDDQFVQETKDEESQEGRDGLVLRLNLVNIDLLAQTGLELGKHVGFKNKANNSLQSRDAHEGRRPFRLDKLPSIVAYTHGWGRRGEALSGGVALVIVVEVCILSIGRLGVCRLSVFRLGIGWLRIGLPVVLGVFAPRAAV